MQVGGALGVAVVGSVLSSRFHSKLAPALAGRHVPGAARQAILGSLGGALAVARIVGGSLGKALARLARTGFAIGSHDALMAAAGVTAAGAVLVLVALPGSAKSEVDDGGDRDLGTVMAFHRRNGIGSGPRSAPV